MNDIICQDCKGYGGNTEAYADHADDCNGNCTGCPVERYKQVICQACEGRGGWNTIQVVKGICGV